MANKVYYVDSVNGSADNDGSSPDKAIVSPFIELDDDTTSKDEPAIFWIRKGSDIKESDAINLGDHLSRIIIGWPFEGEPKYDERPDAGKDAWDDDDYADILLETNELTNGTMVSSDQTFQMYNCKYTIKDDNGVNTVFRTFNTKFYFEKCSINATGGESGDWLFYFDDDDNTEATAEYIFKDCEIRHYKRFIGNTNNRSWGNLTVNIDVYNCDIRGIEDNGSFIAMQMTNKGRLNFINSRYDQEKEDRASFLYQRTNRDGNQQWFYITIEDSYIKSGDYVIAYGRGNFPDIKVKNSELVSYNDYIIYTHIYHNYQGQGDSKIDIQNSKLISGNGCIRYDNSNDGHNWSHLSIVGCDINISGNFIYHDGYNDSSCPIIFKNNKGRIGGTFFYWPNRDRQLTNIYLDFSDMSIGRLFYRLDGRMSVAFKNAKINSLCTGSTDYMFVNAVSSEIGGSDAGYGEIKAVNSKIFGNYSNTIMELQNCDCELNSTWKGIIRNCKTNALPSSVEKGTLSIFTSISKDTPTPYFRIEKNGNLYTTSNITRVNGSPQTVAISNKDSLLRQFILSDIDSSTKSASRVKLFLASQDDTCNMFSYSVAISYIIDGKLYTKSEDIELIEADDQWSGLYDGYKAYRLILPDLDIDASTQPTLTIFGRFDIDKAESLDEETNPIYIDLEPKWEK